MRDDAKDDAHMPEQLPGGAGVEPDASDEARRAPEGADDEWKELTTRDPAFLLDEPHDDESCA